MEPRFPAARLAVLLARAFLAAAVWCISPASAEADAGAGSAGPHFEPSRCWFATDEMPNMRCGRLYVPENRRRSDSRRLSLAVVVWPPEEAAPGEAPAPVVYLAGGPGYGSELDTDGIAGWVDWRNESPWTQGRTLVLMDPRGTGLSEPLMSCPEIDDAYYRYYGRMPQPELADMALWRQAGTACRDRLLAAGVDLSAYDSAAAAADLEDLRRALGFRQWDLWGVSYGTRVALTLMRDHPQGIRTAVLDSLYPPEAMGYAEFAAGTESAFRQLFADCAADAACSRAYPDLAQLLLQAVTWLNERPLSFTVERTDSAEKSRVILDGERFIDLLFSDFYDWERITYLPAIIADAAAGNVALLRDYAEWLGASMHHPQFSDGLQISMECREEFPFNSAEGMLAGRASPPFGGYGLPRLELGICPIWGAGEPDLAETLPVESDIPTLVLAGLYDPITPPAWARAAMPGLRNGFLVEFPGIGHSVMGNARCADDVVADFLDRPQERPSPGCLSRIGPPDFDIDMPDEESDFWERRN